MRQLPLSLKSKAIVSLIILTISSLWDAVYGFGNMPTESVVYQTINFTAGAIVFIFFAKLIRENLKGAEIAYITYVISFYYIAHGALYIYNFVKYWDNWELWIENFYQYAILIPAIMVLLVVLSISKDILLKNVRAWMRKMLIL